MNFLWLDDRLIARDAARIDPADRGLTLGDGLFETMRVSAGHIAHLPRHLDRLRDGAATLLFPEPDLDAIEAALHQVVRRNTLDEGTLRLTLTRGCGPRGLLPPPRPHPTLLIAPFPAAPAPGPASLIVSTRIRRDAHSPLSRIKSLNYLPNILARLEAEQRGADDALLLNGAGQVAESTVSTVLALRDGRLLTPPVADGALPGIARAVLLEAGLVAEASLMPDDLAGGAILVNSLSVRPVVSLDGAPLPIARDMIETVRKGFFFF
ncbi:2-keto-4-methylthiobutyrate aminotransferase [Gluconacetobacter sp. 1b LMG 1731]|uniref:Probable branched-chain-amino-acid aminotransferase n=1 Tax=Gluconacetobacter dulcium TaxID=2729096 RepID=A0A7W4ILZ8_9PROT|nr:aminotransferase class IV [Gluconacetobacter dulcium]MBB2165340.1 2-keto-4-methylthiobutyrate aminotransferase [Gluconacetobacter dulcium]MBB2194493.1 2-keto-4-methylthiobutyrate aminotransferase [Gluconacetobacter dulcium]